MSKRGGWQDSYEQDVVHPAVADILTANGYKYQHEAPMPIRGKVDFLAMHNGDGHLFIVECKASRSGFSKALKQIVDYRDQFGIRVKAALAYPASAITEGISTGCLFEGIGLIQVPVPALMKLSVEIPREWMKPLRQAMGDAKHQSMNTYLRDLIGQSIGKSPKDSK